MKKLLSFVLLTCNVFLHSQNLQWETSYKGPAQLNDEATASILGLDGMIYVVGYSNETGVDADGFFAKLNVQGDTVLTRHYDGSNGDDFFYGVVQDTAMNLYFVGKAKGPLGNFDIIVVSYDSSGTFRWEYTKNGTGNGNDGATNSICIGLDGNLYFGGFLTNSVGNKDFAVLSLSTDGVFRSEYLYNGTAALDDEAGIVLAGRDGAIYASGSSTGIGTNKDLTVIKLDTSLVAKWVYKKDGNASGDDKAFEGMAFDINNNVYVIGQILDSLVMLEFTIISLDTAGVVNWTYKRDGNASANDIGRSVVVGQDGNVYATGISNGGANNDIMVLSVDNSGTERWVYTYNGLSNLEDNSSVLTCGLDGNIYFAGSTNDDGVGQKDWVTGCVNSGNGIEKWVFVTNTGSGIGSNEARAVYQLGNGSIVSAGFTTEGEGKDITVLSLCNIPSADFLVASDTICFGDNFIFANNSSEAFSYEWWEGGNIFSVIKNPTFGSFTIGTHTISLVAVSGVCTDTILMELYVRPRSVMSISVFPNDTICNGNAITLNGGGAVTYSWNNNVTNNVPFIPISSANYIVTGLDVYGCTNKDTARIVVNVCTGIENISRNLFSIFPNPMQTNATLVFEESKAQGQFILYDVCGRKVKSQNFAKGLSTLSFNREDLADGVYFFNLLSDQIVIAKGKVIIN